MSHKYLRDEDFEKDVVDYFKGRNDKLLFETADSNFKVGFEEGKKESIKEIIAFLRSILDPLNSDYTSINYKILQLEQELKSNSMLKEKPHDKEEI